MIEQVKCSTPDFAEENVAKLIKLFPEVEGEKGTVDLDKLRQVLSSKVIEGNVERYEFTWPGKRAAKAAASAATTKTLRPCREESVNFDTTENLYIEGDNLEVLKLLQTSYAGKVKMIYIDPPYNTGHDFVYRDKFSLTQKELEDEAGSFDEDGNRFEVNDSAEARYHSNWCSMMYPRLKLARNLLRDDGVLFMSIDDNEVENLVRLSKEIFGERNYVGKIIVKSNPRGSMSESELAGLHEYLALFAKDRDISSIAGHKLSDDMLSEYKYHDDVGVYRLLGLRMRGGAWRRTDRPTLYYPLYVDPRTERVSIVSSDGCVEVLPIQPTTGEEGTWRWSKENIVSRNSELIAKKVLRNGEEVWDVMQKDYLVRDGERRTKAKTIWDEKEINYQFGTVEVRELFGKSGIFDYSKPTYLLRRVIEMIAFNDEDKILDFFSGSATTAHAVMQLNAEDGGKRKFIMVQLPELCAEDSEAAKAGYKNICEIGKERIRRAGKKIAEENATTAPNLDIGFRVLKLDSSSLNDTSATVSETDQKFSNFDRIKEGRSSEDLLFQMLLETHIPLSDKIEKKTVGGNEVFFVSGTALVACLDAKAKMTTDFFIEIAKLKPGIAFFRDDAFADDSARTNLQQAFDQFSPSTAIKVI